MQTLLGGNEAILDFMYVTHISWKDSRAFMHEETFVVGDALFQLRETKYSELLAECQYAVVQGSPSVLWGCTTLEAFHV
jgi:hypothetical protein